jgi:hypothetical protein
VQDDAGGIQHPTDRRRAKPTQAPLQTREDPACRFLSGCGQIDRLAIAQLFSQAFDFILYVAAQNLVRETAEIS